MPIQVLKVTPSISKLLSTIIEGMILLSTRQINVDYSKLYGFKIRLVLRVMHKNALNITLSPDELNGIKKRMRDLLQTLAKEIFNHNPRTTVEQISINLDANITPKIWANFNNTTRH